AGSWPDGGVRLAQRVSRLIAPVLAAARLKKAIVDTEPKSRRASASSTWDVVTKAMTSPRRPFGAKTNFAASQSPSVGTVDDGPATGGAAVGAADGIVDGAFV